MLVVPCFVLQTAFWFRAQYGLFADVGTSVQEVFAPGDTEEVVTSRPLTVITTTAAGHGKGEVRRNGKI